MERGGGRTRAGFLAAGLAAAVLLGGCAQRTAEPASGQIFAMDTIMSMDVYGEGGEEALARAEETIYRLEDLWAVTDENSEIWALNHSGGAWVDLSQETADLLSRALELCALTDGALDLTAYSAVQAWGFTTGEYRVPSQGELDALIPRIDYTRLELDGDGLRARLPENMELDLGAVAKGYAGTYLAEQLRQAGVTSAILRLGGNIQAVGTRPDGNPWRVAIQDPDSQQEATLGVVEIADQAVITSGGYQRYFEEGGETYWHIMDPDTAAPARSGLTSVTVIGADGTVCDALSTALFVMGPEEAAAGVGGDFHPVPGPDDGGDRPVNRRTAILAGALALVVLACAGFLLWQRASAQAGVSVRIYQYGELVEEVRLDQVTEPYTIPLSGEDGAENLVEVAPGRVRMQSANCPDQVCVNQGWISDASVPVVCLPHQVVLEITGGESHADAAAG